VAARRRSEVIVKVLLCHNYYQQSGGEDESFAAEARLLEAGGHEVLRFTRHNDAIKQMHGWDVGRRALWNQQTYVELRHLIQRQRPIVMHCTNTFPLISPAAYYAARAETVPVVQSLRNYRLLCPNALFHRENRVCEDCLGKVIPWPAVVHACYRQSRQASLAVAGMLAVHRAAKTWRRAVSLYFTPTNFVRRKYVAGGFPPERIVVKPNFVDPDPGVGSGSGGYAVFVGRLAPEKGIETLLMAWAQIRSRPTLRIIGDGPLAGLVQDAAAQDPRIQWMGRRPQSEVLTILGEAACLIVPSTWYETFGRTIIEAYAVGTPVVASRIGAMMELVDEGRTGLLFRPSDARDLACSVGQILTDPARLGQMRRSARERYEAKYTAAINYRLLLEIYEQAARIEASGSTEQQTPDADVPVLPVLKGKGGQA
jgi:glycosyltransferase involved in cell wall biosynthesis